MSMVGAALEVSVILHWLATVSSYPTDALDMIL